MSNEELENDWKPFRAQAYYVMKDAFMFNQTHVRQYMYILFGWTAEREANCLAGFASGFHYCKKLNTQRHLPVMVQLWLFEQKCYPVQYMIMKIY